MSTRGRGRSPTRYYPPPTTTTTTTRRVAQPQPLTVAQPHPQPLTVAQPHSQYAVGQSYYSPHPHTLSTQPPTTLIPYQYGGVTYTPSIAEYATQIPQQETIPVVPETHTHLQGTMPVVSGPTYYPTVIDGQLLLVPQGYELKKI